MKRATKRRLIWLLLGSLGSLIPAAVAVLGVLLLVSAVFVGGNSDESSGSAGWTPAGSVCRVDPAALTLTEVAGFGRGSTPGGDDDQLYNSAVIISVGSARGLSRRDQTIAIMTAIQESGLRNLDYGDRDSLGLFQQRPSMNWGTPEQVRDPVYAAGKFYDALLGITDRDSMSMNDVAQAVQRSGHPDAYGPHEAEATQIVDAIYRDTPALDCAHTGDGMTLEQAQAFMEIYRGADHAEWDVWSCGCAGGCLVNCVSFAIYFVNRYTNAHVEGATGNGADVASYMINTLGFTDGGHVPKPYAVFSRAGGSMLCDGVPCGHTGVVLGIDQTKDEIIIGEAGCGDPDFTGAHVYSLSEWSTTNFTYAYSDAVLKGDLT